MADPETSISFKVPRKTAMKIIAYALAVALFGGGGGYGVQKFAEGQAAQQEKLDGIGSDLGEIKTALKVMASENGDVKRRVDGQENRIDLLAREVSALSEKFALRRELEDLKQEVRAIKLKVDK